MADGSYHHGNLRAALLEKAERVLVTSGAEGLSLRALARELGVSHAAPSRHFRDRRALLDALAVNGFTRLNDRLRAAAAAPGPVPARLEALGRAYVDFAVTHAPLLEFMFTVKHSDDSSAELRELGHRSLDIAAELIAEGQREGLVRADDPGRLAQVAFSALHGLATLAVAALLEETPLSEATDLTLDVLLRGLGAATGD
ncbi:TetR/AcrR family transcriptional regulator [Streptomyces sp. NPDC047718]|uniref:TetR/AcrR family transcriptional regulator n=1 Tax=Streptomyces sp. NPDC047718 TaxID=3155479 RepID=UPI0033E3A278